MSRPLKFQSVDELKEKIKSYFSSLLNDDGSYKRPPTITGLALHLDTTRETLLDYQVKDEYSDTVKAAKLRVECFAEEQLYVGKAAAGPIFALKNFGWRDSQDLNHGGQKDNPIKTEMDNEALARMERYINKVKRLNGNPEQE